jgi:ABC-type phosphate transport system substrate-binding protein
MACLRNAALSGAAAITLIGAMTLLGTTAKADPPSGVTPQPTDIVAVGSQSTQALSDQLAADYDTTGPTYRFYSWDAVNPTTGLPGGTIMTKNDTNCVMTRPNGGLAGLAQLQLQVLTHGGYPCVDIATYDGVPPSGDVTGLVGVTFGEDLVVYADNAGGNAVNDLTAADLTAIYQCDAKLISSAYPDAPVTWNEVGGTSTDAVAPVLPQAGSDIRADWLASLGLTTPGSCVINGSFGGQPIEENEGTSAVFTPAGNPAGYRDVIVPYSAGDYVGQVYTHANPVSPGGLTLGSENGVSPITSGDTLNAGDPTNSDPLGDWQHKCKPCGGYGIPVSYQNLLGVGDPDTGWICSAAAISVVERLGFLPSPSCGITIP